VRFSNLTKRVKRKRKRGSRNKFGVLESGRREEKENKGNKFGVLVSKEK
jgi:hypothetical protein